MTNKSKDLSITDYLDVLQKEYLVAEIRHKIYPKLSDKAYWERVMDGKKQKVEDICFRNKIGSIFDDEMERRRLYEIIYNETGIPNFSYKNDQQRYGSGDFPGLEETDILNYYADGADVRVDYSERKLGKITGNDIKKGILYVEIENVEYECEIELVTRIL